MGAPSNSNLFMVKQNWQSPFNEHNKAFDSKGKTHGPMYKPTSIVALKNLVTHPSPLLNLIFIRYIYQVCPL